MNEPVKLVTSRPDTEVAKEIRIGLETAMQPLLEKINAAKALGFDVAFALSPTYNGSIGIANLTISKQF